MGIPIPFNNVCCAYGVLQTQQAESQMTSLGCSLL